METSVDMKKVEAIIRPENLSEVKEALEQIGVRGMTVSEVLGCGTQKGHKQVYRGMEIGMTLLNKIKIDVVTDAHGLEKIVGAIMKTCQTGEIGDGKIFIYPVEKVIRIRTGEVNDKAM